jgi:hypothetical protein
MATRLKAGFRRSQLVGSSRAHEPDAPKSRPPGLDGVAEQVSELGRAGEVVVADPGDPAGETGPEIGAAVPALLIESRPGGVVQQGPEGASATISDLRKRALVEIEDRYRLPSK